MRGHAFVRPDAGRTWSTRDRRSWVSLTVALGSAGVVLGPLYGRGTALWYDMAWSPVPTWTPFVLGVSTPAPRAVPSDAVAVLLSRLVGPGLAQVLVLTLILVLASHGAVALLRAWRQEVGVVACASAALAAQWNPFVVERLAIGHWTVLWGYALAPLVFATVLRDRSSAPRQLVLLALAVGLGGANALAVQLPAWAYAAWQMRLRAVPGMAILTGVSSVWALPALSAGVRSSAAAAGAFGPVSDSPLGVLGSLLAGGALWNTRAHPWWREESILAVAALMLTLLSLWGATCARRGAGVVAVTGAGVVIAALSAVDGLRPLWEAALTHIPGWGLMRDSQKLVGCWVVVAAAGSGLIVDALRGRRWGGAQKVAATGLLCLWPVLNLGLAWGLMGRLGPVALPTSYRAIAAQASEVDGTIALLPWQQYRRYSWNAGRTSLTIAPRVIDGDLLFDDRLPLRSGQVIPGEDPRAAGVSASIDSGASLREALSSAGSSYAFVERGTPGAPELGDLGTVVVEGPEAALVRLGSPPLVQPPTRSTAAVKTGWALTCGTAVLSIFWALLSWRRDVRALRC